MEDNELLVNAIVLSRVVSDELKGDTSYESVLRVADDLNLTPYQVQAFYKLYKHIQTIMVICGWWYKWVI